MFGGVWEFFRNESNRIVIAWAGGGIVVVISGLWAVFKFLYKKPSSVTTLIANHSSQAAGRDLHAATPPDPRRKSNPRG